MDGTDINAVDRSPDKTLLATGDDFGKVKLFHFPCLTDGGSMCTVYSGHSSHVTNVRWVNQPKSDQQYLISLGGEDKSIFQWKSLSTGNDKNKSTVSDVDGLNLNQIDLKMGGGSSSSNDEDDSEQTQLEVPSGGDEFMV